MEEAVTKTQSWPLASLVQLLPSSGPSAELRQFIESFEQRGM